MSNAPEAQLYQEWDQLYEVLAKTLADDVISLGGLYVQLGRALRTQVKAVPPQFVTALEKCADKTAATPMPSVRSLITQRTKKTFNELFETFEEQPLVVSAAGQVQLARLQAGIANDGTRAVAVKTLHRHAYSRIHDDAKTIKAIAKQVFRASARAAKGRELVDSWVADAVSQADLGKDAAGIARIAENMARPVPEAVGGGCDPWGSPLIANVNVGSRVMADYKGKGAGHFPATVKAVDPSGPSVDLAYDDGVFESGASLAQIVLPPQPKFLVVGKRIRAMFRGKDVYYPGRIERADVEGNKFEIKYDDGDSETGVPLKHLASPIDPYELEVRLSDALAACGAR